MKLVIMAGGSGTRLWPVSRKKEPKQVKPFFGNETLLQKSFKRLRKGFPLKDIYISSNINQKKFIKQQLPNFPEKQLILEPIRKDTAAAIGYFSLILSLEDPKAIIATINSDQYISDVKKYLKFLKLSQRVVEKYPKKILLIGINPTYPETGYGYIKLGEKIKTNLVKALFQVEKFVEKPDLVTAKHYLTKWNYLWNPAIFVFRVDYMLELFKKYLPQQFNILKKIKESPVKLNKEFPKIKPISIDYGIMEKT